MSVSTGRLTWNDFSHLYIYFFHLHPSLSFSLSLFNTRMNIISLVSAFSCPKIKWFWYPTCLRIKIPFLGTVSLKGLRLMQQRKESESEDIPRWNLSTSLSMIESYPLSPSLSPCPSQRLSEIVFPLILTRTNWKHLPRYRHQSYDFAPYSFFLFILSFFLHHYSSSL